MIRHSPDMRAFMHSRAVTVAAAALVCAFVPCCGGDSGTSSPSNWQRHDRARNFVARDHGINLLDSCAPDAILFTLGDNDTYPLWYLQQAAGYRADVTVVNLSLLNAPWYIRQLRDNPRSELLADLSGEFIDERLSGGMTSYTTLRWPVEPAAMAAAGIRWTMPPSWVAPDSSYGLLSTANYLTVRIIDEVDWSRPIYFAAPLPPEHDIGLDPYLVHEGLVYRLGNIPSDNGLIRIDTERMASNLDDVWRLDSITDESVYRSPDTAHILGVYFEASLSLMEEYARTGDMMAITAEAERARILADGHPGRHRSLDEALRQWGLDTPARKNNGGPEP